MVRNHIHYSVLADWILFTIFEKRMVARDKKYFITLNAILAGRHYVCKQSKRMGERAKNSCVFYSCTNSFNAGIDMLYKFIDPDYLI